MFAYDYMYGILEKETQGVLYWGQEQRKKKRVLDFTLSVFRIRNIGYVR